MTKRKQPYPHLDDRYERDRMARLMCVTAEGHEIRQPLFQWSRVTQLRVLFLAARGDEKSQKNIS